MSDEHMLGRLTYEQKQGTLDTYITLLPKMAQTARARYEDAGLDQPDWINVRDALHQGTVSQAPRMSDA